MKNGLKLLAYIYIATIISSCKEVEQPIVQDTAKFEVTVNSDLSEFLKIMGYDKPEILNISISGSDFIIDDEIIIHQRDIDRFTLLRKSPNFLWRKNYYTSTTPGTKRNIGFCFYDNFSTSFKNKVIEAFNTWNGIRNFNINFIEVDESYLGDKVYIFAADPNSSTVIQVNKPWESGSVGDMMNLGEQKLTNTLSSLKSKWALIHSIGHLIGIGHETDSNNSQFQLVPGTRVGDPTMYQSNISYANNNTSGVPNWAGFHYSDLLGIRYLWPHDSSEKPLYSYISTNSGWGNWTTNWLTYGYGTSQYGYWGVTGYIYTAPKTGTVPLYKYTHVSGTPYISTTSNLNVSYPSFTYNGPIGNVYTSSGQSRVPVYEWYNPSVGYFFTTNAIDNYVQGAGWVGGGIAFYVLSLI